MLVLYGVSVFRQQGLQHRNMRSILLGFFMLDNRMTVTGVPGLNQALIVEGKDENKQCSGPPGPDLSPPV